MPFNYYHRLSRRRQQIYRKSDDIESVRIPDTIPLFAITCEIESALSDESRKYVQLSAQKLAGEICRQLSITPVTVKVLAKRPSNNWGELHGLYQPCDPPDIPEITVWMRTAQRKQVVAFKTFLRTLLHEVGHHLDYEYFRFEESFHTEGFYKRENHLFNSIRNQADTPKPVQHELFPVSS